MNFEPIKFVGFDDREKQLKNIIRYHPYKPMFYRTNLLIHSRRVCAMVEELIPVILKYFSEFDVKAARIMSLIHDDIEIIIGDIQFGTKLRMSEIELAELLGKELSAVDILSQKFPKNVEEYQYGDLLRRTQLSDPGDLEATIVKYCDKMDGYCEAIHELAAGNNKFLKGFEIGIIPPVDAYRPLFKNFGNKYPLFKKIENEINLIFNVRNDFDEFGSAARGELHGKESFEVNSGIPQYEFWKKVTLQKLANGLELLTKRIE